LSSAPASWALRGDQSKPAEKKWRPATGKDNFEEYLKKEGGVVQMGNHLRRKGPEWQCQKGEHRPGKSTMRKEGGGGGEVQAPKKKQKKQSKVEHTKGCAPRTFENRLSATRRIRESGGKDSAKKKKGKMKKVALEREKHKMPQPKMKGKHWDRMNGRNPQHREEIFFCGENWYKTCRISWKGVGKTRGLRHYRRETPNIERRSNPTQKTNLQEEKRRLLGGLRSKRWFP